MELQELRRQIDRIDTELVSLFKQRMALSAAVAEYKQKNGLPVLDSSRERELLEKVAALSGREFAPYTHTLYATVLELSRSYQHTLLGDDLAASEVER